MRYFSFWTLYNHTDVFLLYKFSNKTKIFQLLIPTFWCLDIVKYFHLSSIVQYKFLLFWWILMYVFYVRYYFVQLTKWRSFLILLIPTVIYSYIYSYSMRNTCLIFDQLYVMFFYRSDFVNIDNDPNVIEMFVVVRHVIKFHN